MSTLTAKETFTQQLCASIERESARAIPQSADPAGRIHIVDCNGPPHVPSGYGMALRAVRSEALASRRFLDCWTRRPGRGPSFVTAARRQRTSGMMSADERYADRQRSRKPRRHRVHCGSFRPARRRQDVVVLSKPSPRRPGCGTSARESERVDRSGHRRTRDDRPRAPDVTPGCSADRRRPPRTTSSG